MAETTEVKKKKSKAGVIILSILGLLVCALAGGYVYEAKQYENKFLPKTTMNGVDISEKTVDEVKADILKEVEEYSLTITSRKNITDTFTAADVGLQMDLGTQVEDALKAQNEWYWPYLMLNPEAYTTEKSISCDEEKLAEVISNMNCKDKKQALKPTDAHISEFVEGTGYSVIPEEENNRLIADVFDPMVKEAVLSLDTEITAEDLEAAEAYKRPKVFSDDTTLNKRVDQLNKYCNTKITYKFGKDKVVVTGETIAEWIDFTKKNKAKLNEEKVAEFVAGLARKYDTFNGNGTRTFKTSYGKKVKIKGGDYGWWMNRDETTSELVAAIKKGEDVTLKPVYRQEANSYGKSDWGDTYVEVNLTAQKLFLYKNGKCILKSDFVSGKPSIKNTPSGVYAITYKETVHTMEGDASDPYRVETMFWMPFAGGVGLHDATWRSVFGGTIYKSSGSHGCVNLPYNTAKKIYNTLDKGSPVICYRLSGTERRATSGQSAKEIAGIAIDAIDRIGTVVKGNAACKERVRWARQVYTDIGGARSYVTNYSKLVAAEKKLR